jgi:hypothetical protein
MSDKTESLKASMVSEAKMMSNMEGSEQKGDVVMACAMPEALAALHDMMQKAAAAAAAAGKQTWELRGVHIGQGPAAGKTLDDFLVAFLHWCQKDEDRAAGRFNVSKAMRRLTSFAEYQVLAGPHMLVHVHACWPHMSGLASHTPTCSSFFPPTCQEKLFHKFFSDPVETSEPGFAEVAKMFNIKIPEWTSKRGTVMWIMDLGKMELDGEALSDRILMRWMWYQMVASVFDYACAIEGAEFVMSFDNMDFGSLMKMNAKFHNVEQEMQSMFYGCAPFKMKASVLVDAPWWINFIMAIVRLFLSKKMSARIVNTDAAGMYAVLGGPEYLPVGFYGGTREYVYRYPLNK